MIKGVVEKLAFWKGRKGSDKPLPTYIEVFMENETLFIFFLIFILLAFYFLVGDLRFFGLYVFILFGASAVAVFWRYESLPIDKLIKFFIGSVIVILFFGYAIKINLDHKYGDMSMQYYAKFLNDTDEYVSYRAIYFKLRYFRELADKDINFREQAQSNLWLFDKFKLDIAKGMGTREDYRNLVIYYNYTLNYGGIDDFLARMDNAGYKLTVPSMNIPSSSVTSQGGGNSQFGDPNQVYKGGMEYAKQADYTGYYSSLSSSVSSTAAGQGNSGIVLRSMNSN